MTQQSFIETQFPVSKVSKESYKERMANYSQTLTGLGKWWGRKPLILVRATLLGLLLPASDKPEKDREIFFKILTMDDEGMWLRKSKPIAAKDIYAILSDEAQKHESRIEKKKHKYYEQFPTLVHDSVKHFISKFILEKDGKFSWVKKIDPKEKEVIEKFAFDTLYYDERLDYCSRPEQVNGPSKEAWADINQHLGTNVSSLVELFQELGKQRFGHIPRVGDAFCGGGSIPFEAARMGCEVYASDLNPVAALLTWAALNIIGGGEEVAKEVRKAQEEIYNSVDKQVTEWGIEHNEFFHRADAYLYCVEVIDPETGWKVPLAPSWVIGEKTKTVAILVPDEANKRYAIKIKMNATDEEMKIAKLGTVQNNYVVHPKNPNKVPMGLIRKEPTGGLRLWEKTDIIPREDDVFQERLYCIRYVEKPLSERIYEFAKLCLESENNDAKKMTLLPVEEKLAKKIQADLEIDISEFQHTIDKYAIKKIFKDHGDKETEEKRGQIAVTLDILKWIGFVVRSYDSIEYRGENKKGLETILYKKEIEGVVFYMEEIRTGKKELALNTMYVQKQGKGRDDVGKTNPAPSSETSPLLLHYYILEKFSQGKMDESDSKNESRYYTAPTREDLDREEKTVQLLKERFADWQDKGYIPSRKIEDGDKTSEPIRTRGWHYWHQLFNPRQLLVNGLFMEKGCTTDAHGWTRMENVGVENFQPVVRKSLTTKDTKSTKEEKRVHDVITLLAVGRCADWNSKLSRWWTDSGHEKVVQVFSNMSLNTLSNYGTRGLIAITDSWFIKESTEKISFLKYNIKPIDARLIDDTINIWITDPPYADAINYHELTEFFLSWYEKHLTNLFPQWYSDSKRAVAIKGQEFDFRKSMVEVYSNLNKQMSNDGLQVVMFTHQDAGVWADLALILWASGLKVTTAWTIATETSFGKKGNYVQGTVLLVLRKNTSEESVFLDELNPLIELEVKRQIDSMLDLEDKEEPNFADTDYQLAAYAAALRILTNYRKIGDIDIRKELERPRTKSEKNPLEVIIENARNVGSAYLLPQGMTKSIWTDLKPEERLYLKGLDLEAKGENRSGAYQELARSYGVREYKDLLANSKANEVRLKNPTEFGNQGLSGEGFADSLLRAILFAIHTSVLEENPSAGKNYLKTDRPKSFDSERVQIIALLKYLSRFQHTLTHWKKPSEMSDILAGLIANEG